MLPIPLNCFQGLWQYTKMPFGLHRAPALFQMLVNQVLARMEKCAAIMILLHMARVAPLSDLTSTAKSKMVWGEDQEKAVCQEQVLQNFNLTSTAQTDASHRGIGGVLLLYKETEKKKKVSVVNCLLWRPAVELKC